VDIIELKKLEDFIQTCRDGKIDTVRAQTLFRVGIVRKNEKSSYPASKLYLTLTALKQNPVHLENSTIYQYETTYADLIGGFHKLNGNEEIVGKPPLKAPVEAIRARLLLSNINLVSGEWTPEEIQALMAL